MLLRKILIGDDQQVSIFGIRHILTGINSDLTIVEASNLNDLLNHLTNSNFDLLILDIHILDKGKASKMSAILKVISKAKILIFSGYDERRYALPFLQAGAHGFLPKSSSEQEVRIAIDRVMDGERYLSSLLQQLSLDYFFCTKVMGPFGLIELTARERGILPILLRGESTADIGYKLNLKMSTVSTHKKNIFRKLRVRNVVELIQVVGNLKDVR